MKNRGLTLEDVVRHHPETRFIVLRRRDMIQCAVSWYIANHTLMWAVRTKAEAKALARHAPIPLDRDRLLASYHGAVRADAYWQREKQALSSPPLELFYEDLIADPVGWTARVLAYLGIDFDPEACVRGVTHEKQSVPARDRAVDQGTEVDGRSSWGLILYALIIKNTLGSPWKM